MFVCGRSGAAVKLLTSKKGVDSGGGGSGRTSSHANGNRTSGAPLQTNSERNLRGGKTITCATAKLSTCATVVPRETGLQREI